MFAGAGEMIEGLYDAGVLLAVATGKSRRGLDKALDESGLGLFFHATRCADEAFSKTASTDAPGHPHRSGYNARAGRDGRRYRVRYADGTQCRRSRQWPCHTAHAPARLLANGG